MISATAGRLWHAAAAPWNRGRRKQRMLSLIKELSIEFLLPSQSLAYVTSLPRPIGGTSPGRCTPPKC
jgi:hypothetical protein